jgi:hypothetical protein
MWTRKILAVTVILLLVSLLMSGAVSAKGTDLKFKSIPAKDIMLIKKQTVNEPQSWTKGHNRQKVGAATGVLGQTVSRHKYAVVIGISDYPGTSSDLKYADDDAQTMADVLIGVYGFSPADVTVLIDSNAAAQNILDAVNEVKDKTKAGDEVVFFFSGHGGSGIADDGDNEKWDEAIVCWGDNQNFAYIWDGQLKDWFSGFETSRIVFIFDSCYAGGMDDLAGPGRVICAASGENTFSYEYASLQHGEFTYYFAGEGINQGYADIYDHNQDGFLGQSSDVVVEEAFDYAKANCKHDNPVISDNFSNDLLP